MQMKRIILFLISITMVTGSFSVAFADNGIQIAVDYTEPVNALIPGWEFPYEDEWFTAPADIINRQLAKGSLGLTVSAFSNNEKTGLELQYETYLGRAGFMDIHPFGYDIPRNTDTFAGVIGRRKIGAVTLIAIVGRGSDYGKEWGGNLDLGDGAVHAGFKRAAKILEDELDAYLVRFPADGPVRIWISGYSRSAAAGNIAAADWISSGRFDAVYAYLFACPRVTKEPAECPGIFNIIGTQDCVPQIPMQTYGYERNGKDLYLPSMETVSGFAEMKNIASEISRKLTGKEMIVNPKDNLMLRLFIGFLTQIFPAPEDYREQFQQKMFETDDTWNDNESISSLLPGMLAGLTGVRIPEDRKYLLSTIAQLSSYYLLRSTGVGKDDDVKNGYWNPDESAYSNIIREHKISTYIAWMFSSLPDEVLFRPAEQERILFIDNCKALTVSCGGEIKWTLLKGIAEKASEDAAGWVQSKSGAAMVILPTDEDYAVLFETGDGTLRAMDTIIRPDETMCSTCVTYVNETAWNGAYEFTAHGSEPLNTVSSDSEKITVKRVSCGAEHLTELATMGFDRKAKELFENKP